jgi:hypothetical protein
MKAMAASILVLASIVTIHFALGEPPPDRPAGVDAQHWIPVSDKLGFVDTSPHPFPPGDAMLEPPTEGYFMIRNRNGWHRIVIENPLKGPGTSG